MTERHAECVVMQSLASQSRGHQTAQCFRKSPSGKLRVITLAIPTGIPGPRLEKIGKS